MTLSDRLPAVVATGFAYTECPRWHDGRLWFSDQYDGWVYALAPDGDTEPVVAVPGRPAGLGWLPDGRLLVVSMERHELLVLDAGELHPVADLGALHGGPSNDMVVDALGRAYVGNIGFDYYGGEQPRPTVIALVDPATGRCSVAADDLLVPNGTVLTPDGELLVVAESFGHRLTAFEVAPDGNLSGRRVFADLGDHVPDGICLDAEGAVWAAVVGGGVLRVEEGGRVTDCITFGKRRAYACALGGPDRQDLFVCTAGSDEPAVAVAKRDSAIERVRVGVPGAGLP
jgi:sugar lactone lactonase YvrE